MELIDFFRPKWKNSDSNVRLFTVRDQNFSDQKTLTEIVIKDENIDVRCEAVVKITDLNLLNDVAKNAKSKSARKNAKKRLKEIKKK